MRPLALVTVVAMAAPLAGSVAVADPPYRDDDRPYRTDRYDRDDYPTRDYHQDRDFRRGRWVPLAESNPTAGSERQFINVVGRGGALRKLVISGDRGAPVITRVAIEYNDRSVQTVEINARLRRGDDERIDLRGNRPLNRIVVYTDPRSRGAYSIYGA